MRSHPVAFVNDLFNPNATASWKERLRPRLAELAQTGIYIGTSSWKYPGWLGQIYSPERYEYRGKLAKGRFEAECLTEYAEVFRTVCVDAGYYRFPDPEFLRKIMGQAPDGFKFSFKVTDEITLKHFPRQARHGARAGLDNPNFLNTELFLSEFLGPLAPYQKKVGTVIFEFARFSERDYRRGREFVEALDGFLGRLPSGWQFGVEIRNGGFLQPEYFGVLREHGISHVFNAWTAMPPVAEQIAMEDAFTTDFFAARFLLKSGRSYEQAVKKFSPYREVQEVQAEEREMIRKLSLKKTRKGSYVYVNNRLEGNALQTIAAALHILVGEKAARVIVD